MSQPGLIIGIYYSFNPQLSPDQLEELYQKQYKQTLTSIYNRKDVKLVLYYSGPLLNWFERKHPEYIAVLNELRNQNRVELLSGPYYEALLPLLSVSDSLGQIEKMTTQLRKVLKKRTRGCWIPGSIWDQRIVSNLSNSGFNYTFLDQTHFEQQGENETYKLYQTEDNGKRIELFPIHVKMAEKIKSQQWEKVSQEVHKILRKNGLLCLFYSGNNIVKKGLLNKILNIFDSLKEWNMPLVPCLPGQYIKTGSSRKKIFLSSSGINQYKDFFSDLYNEERSSHKKNNSHFKNFISDDLLSNYLYGKTTYTSLLINQIRGDRSRKKLAKEFLWKAQSTYGYWNNIDAYLTKRDSLSYLMEAEKLTREKGIFKSSLVSNDVNNDGIDEYLFLGNYYNAAVHSLNSTMFQLDYLPDCWNYLFNEWGMASFHDIFLKEDGSMDSIKKQIKLLNVEQDSPYRMDRDDKQIIFKREANPMDIEGFNHPVNLEKRYLFKRNWFVLSYKFKNEDDSRRSYNFSTNLSFSLPDLSKEKFDLKSQAEKSSLQKMKSKCFHKSSSINLLDKMNNTDIQLDFNQPMDVHIDNFKKENWDRYFNLNLFPRIAFQLYPQETFELSITIKLSKHR